MHPINNRIFFMLWLVLCLFCSNDVVSAFLTIFLLYFYCHRQLSLDSAFLESQHIIDYSLLLGLHFRAPEHLRSLLEPPDSQPSAENPNDNDGEVHF